MFRLPVKVSPKDKHHSVAGTTSHVTNTSPVDSPQRTQSNKQYNFFYGKAECLLERANYLIVDCISMSEYLAKLPTRVEHRRTEGGEGREKT